MLFILLVISYVCTLFLTVLGVYCVVPLFIPFLYPIFCTPFAFSFYVRFFLLPVCLLSSQVCLSVHQHLPQVDHVGNQSQAEPRMATRLTQLLEVWKSIGTSPHYGHFSMLWGYVIPPYIQYVFICQKYLYVVYGIGKTASFTHVERLSGTEWSALGPEVSCRTPVPRIRC